MPDRGEIWLVDLSPTRGHEQGGERPALIVSVNTYNHGPAGLVVVLPVTSVDRGIPIHVPIKAPEGGLDKDSVILCDHIRAISRQRLVHCFGSVSAQTMADVEDRLCALLGL